MTKIISRPVKKRKFKKILRENPVWKLTLRLPVFYDAFSSAPVAAIFLIDVEQVFFAPWPQNFSRTTREKVKVGFTREIEQGFASFSVFMMHFPPAQLFSYFWQT